MRVDVARQIGAARGTARQQRMQHAASDQRMADQILSQVEAKVLSALYCNERVEWAEIHRTIDREDFQKRETLPRIEALVVQELEMQGVEYRLLRREDSTPGEDSTAWVELQIRIPPPEEDRTSEHVFTPRAYCQKCGEHMLATNKSACQGRIKS